APPTGLRSAAPTWISPASARSCARDRASRSKRTRDGASALDFAGLQASCTLSIKSRLRATAGPRPIEIGNEQLEIRAVGPLGHFAIVLELGGRIVDRCPAAAPEPPAFLAVELVHRQRQMVGSIPLIKFRAVGLVWHLRSNHEIGLPRFHACSSLRE